MPRIAILKLSEVLVVAFVSAVGGATSATIVHRISMRGVVAAYPEMCIDAITREKVCMRWNPFDQKWEEVERFPLKEDEPALSELRGS